MSARGPSVGRGLVVGSFLAMLALSIPNAYGAAVPSVAAASGVGVATVGQLATIHGAGAFVGLLLWIRQGPRRPTGRVLSAALGTLLLGALAIAANPAAARTATGATAFVVLAATVAVVGFAFGIGIVATNSVLANRGADPRLLNAANAMYGLGAVGLPLLVGVASLRVSALVVAGVAAVTLPWLRHVPDLGPELRAARDDRAAVRAERRRAGRRRRGAGELARWAWSGTGSRPWVWMFGVAIGVELGTAAWAATHLVSVGVGEARAAAAVAGFFAAFTAARIAMAGVGDRLPLRGVVVGSNLLAAGAAVAVTVTPAPTIAWVVVGVGVGPVFPTTLAWLTRVTGDPDGARRMNVGGAVGGVLLTGAIGGLVGLVGPGAIPWAVAAYAVGAAGLAATLPRTDDRRPAAAGAATSTHP